MDITCEYDISKTRFRCVVKKITFNISNKIRVNSDYKGKDSVPELDISEIPLYKFPRGVGETFPSLQRLWIVGCGLKEITRHDFLDLTSLKTLNLKKNFIEEIREDVFMDLTGLKYLSLSHNNIRIVHPKAFDPLTNLERLNLQSNLLIHGVYKDLKDEVTRRNAFQHIEDKCKVPLPDLKTSPHTSTALKSSPHTPPCTPPKTPPKPSSFKPRTLIQHRSIYIGNLHSKVTQDDIQHHFRHCGPIEFIIIPRHFGGEPRGFAFVEFKSSKAVNYALEEHDSTLGNYRISVMRKRAGGNREFLKRESVDDRRDNKRDSEEIRGSRGRDGDERRGRSADGSRERDVDERRNRDGYDRRGRDADGSRGRDVDERRKRDGDDRRDNGNYG